MVEVNMFGVVVLECGGRGEHVWCGGVGMWW